MLRGTDLDALPDDQDDPSLTLQALAGPSAGLGGGETYIDGFSDGQLPPKESIREIRINRNPFSAELIVWVMDVSRFSRNLEQTSSRAGVLQFRG